VDGSGEGVRFGRLLEVVGTADIGGAKSDAGLWIVFDDGGGPDLADGGGNGGTAVDNGMFSKENDLPRRRGLGGFHPDLALRRHIRLEI
jgi:hypothetical protein